MEILTYLVDLFLHLDKHLAELILEYGNWTYAILFLVIFCETGLVIAPFLPGDSLLFATGALAATGALDPNYAFLLMASASILGDNTNYTIGRFIGPKAFSTNSRILKKEYLTKTRAFYDKYGGRTIIVGRFLPIIRTFAPFVAGVAKMDRRKYVPFTLIGATTRAGLLTSPMRARFGVVGRLDYYSGEDIARVITRSARILKTEIDTDGCGQIAGRSRGTPRIANRLLRRLRDFAEVHGDGRITGQLAHDSLERLDVDEMGLDDMDKRILCVLIEKFHGGPVGLSTLAVAVGEEAETLEEIYEPFLIQEGLLERTPRGRTATSAAFTHLKYDRSEFKQGRLL